jgi:ATP phosphoribosyltransferase
VLISNPHTTHASLVDVITQRIQGYITASQHVMISYNCPRDQLKEACRITPGHDSPTVTPLDDESAVSVTALVRGDDVSDIMDNIKAIGGQSIVVMDVINCRF